MVLKPLPHPLVRRLNAMVRKKGEEEVYQMMGRLEYADARAHLRDRPYPEGSVYWEAVPRNNTREWGRRVRAFNISRNYPNTSLVLKRTHSFDAKSEVEEIQKSVAEYNFKRPVGHVLLFPYAYAIGDSLVAMSRTDKPSLSEVISGESAAGKKMRMELRGMGFDKRKLEEIRASLSKKANLKPQNVLVVGVKGNVLQFVPLIDRI